MESPTRPAAPSNDYSSITRATKLFALCAAVNSLNLGYDIGVNTGIAPLLEESMDLSETQVEIFIGSINLFAMVGSLASGYISDAYGRRGTFKVAAVGFVVGVLTMATAQSFAVLMLGRVLVGIGVGFGLAIDPLYISELSPPEHRGRLVTWSEFSINVGILLGFSSGLAFYGLEPDAAWRLMVGLGALLPIVMIVLVVCVMPESPRWLVSKGRNEEAVSVLQRLYGPDYNVTELAEAIHESLQKEQEAERTMGWGILLYPTPAFKRILLVGVGVAASQQLVGIDSIQYFLSYILEQSGVTDRKMQGLVLIMFGLLKVVMVFVAANLLDSKGRRPVFFLSLIVIFLSLIMLAINFVVGGENHSSSFTIFCLALYLAAFGVGMGPGAWLIPSEVFPLSIRAKAMSLATFVNRFVATIMASTVLSLTKVISWAGYFVGLATVAVIILVLMYLYLPETSGKSLEEMTVYFAQITGDASVLEVEEAHVAAKTIELSEEGGRRGGGEEEDDDSASGGVLS
mmetsp:Transcript_10152/g.12920  ORF Transcript_10152/g.12920 Transcript_10152/m.12920 type:complete len:515 (+) Transcript_10152:142-1686(+)